MNKKLIKHNFYNKGSNYTKDEEKYFYLCTIYKILMVLESILVIVSSENQ